MLAQFCTLRYDNWLSYITLRPDNDARIHFASSQLHSQVSVSAILQYAKTPFQHELARSTALTGLTACLFNLNNLYTHLHTLLLKTR